jgi:hypothetical protein
MKKTIILFIYILVIYSFSNLNSAGSGPVGIPENLPVDTAIIVIKKCQDFKVSGDGTASQWNMANWIALPPVGPNPSDYKTAVKILYSETGIYFLFNCGDKKLTTTMQADDLNLWEEDVVEVFLWTSEDFPVYFEYEISPMNYELPILVPNYKGKFLGWLPWNYDGKRTQHATSAIGGEKKSGAAVSGWMAEIYIPYKLLNPLPKVPPVAGTKWRANMYRVDYDNGTTRFAWQKTSGNFHEYNSFGTFIFE